MMPSNKCRRRRGREVVVVAKFAYDDSSKGWRNISEWKPLIKNVAEDERKRREVGNEKRERGLEGGERVSDTSGTFRGKRGPLKNGCG